MKKIIVMIISLMLVGCNIGAKSQVTRCSKTIDEPIKISRDISLYHKDNLITKVSSVETFYFEESFTPEMFEKLKASMLERHAGSKNLTFDFEILSDKAIMTTQLLDVDKAKTVELMLVGLAEEDIDFLPGIAETVRVNEREGYLCKVVDE